MDPGAPGGPSGPEFRERLATGRAAGLVRRLRAVSSGGRVILRNVAAGSGTEPERGVKAAARAAWRWRRCVAHRIGDFQARVLLTVFYYVILGPFALVLRRGDPLGNRARRRPPAAGAVATRPPPFRSRCSAPAPVLMNILGLSFYYHDSSAALCATACSSPRRRRSASAAKKHDSGFPQLAIDFCLTHGRHHDAGPRLRRLLREAVRQVRAHAAHGHADLPALGGGLPRVDAALAPREAVDQVDDAARELGVRRLASCSSPSTTCRTPPARFFCSPFEEAAILTVDGAGEWTTATMGVGRGNEIELLKEIRFPHSLGLLVLGLHRVTAASRSTRASTR